MVQVQKMINDDTFVTPVTFDQCVDGINAGLNRYNRDSCFHRLIGLAHEGQLSKGQTAETIIFLRNARLEGNLTGGVAQVLNKDAPQIAECVWG